MFGLVPYGDAVVLVDVLDVVVALGISFAASCSFTGSSSPSHFCEQRSRSRREQRPFVSIRAMSYD